MAGSRILSEADHEIVSTGILQENGCRERKGRRISPPFRGFKKDCCQAKLCARSTGVVEELLCEACQKKVWLGELTVPT